jgi:hypothetical protein
MIASAAYPQWKAPTEDGDVLLWPAGAEVLTQANENHGRLADCKISLQNIPLHEVRRLLRNSLGISDDVIIFADGHQTELYHPGVWAKLAVASAAASKVDAAQAVHFAVDVDQPKHLWLRCDDKTVPITDDARLPAAAWSGILKSPSNEYLNQLPANAVSEFLAELKTQPKTKSLSQSLMDSMRALDESLGLRGRSILLSPLLDSPAYLVFAHHFLSRPQVLAQQYAAALAGYRLARGIRSTTRPMPDLLARDDECESPFWLDDLSTGTRRRAMLSRSGEQWTLGKSNDRIALDPSADGWAAAEKLRAFLAAHQLRLAPRAITLTMFLRLLAADEFIHGIGGGQYDQVTDALIARYFAIAPPHFCVATATLYLPGASGQKRVSPPHLKHELHQMAHRLLAEAKMEMVADITALPRRSPQRQIEFAQMRQRLADAAAASAQFKDTQACLREAQALAASEKILFDRELFYAIQPKERLQSLAARCSAFFAQAP